jgi:hypothetical protein
MSGSAENGDRVLRILRAVCHFSQQMIGINIPDLKTIYWNVFPTLLFNEPNLTKQMATFLGCSTRRGYLQGCWQESKDFRGSKAIYGRVRARRPDAAMEFAGECNGHDCDCGTHSKLRKLG